MTHRALALVVVLVTPGCLLVARRDTIPSMLADLPTRSQEQAKASWRARLKAQEMDFIRLLSDGRALIGTLESANWGWGLVPAEIQLLDAANGQVVWASPRGFLGHPQTLLATEPVILLEGSERLAAFEQGTGALLWKRERPHVVAVPAGDGQSIVLLSKTKSSVAVTAVAVRSGDEIWNAAVENHPEDVPLQATIAGDVLVLVGPEIHAFSAANGRPLWRIAFPGTFGGTSAAVVLGDGAYFTDGSTITRIDPASGKVAWRLELRGNAVRYLSASDRSVFAVSSSTGDGSSPDAIQAVDRRTGGLLWRSALSEKAQGPMVIDGEQLYVTTTSTFVALKTLDGSPLFKVSVPPRLRRPRMLPDVLRVTADRIVVAREAGVMAVDRREGRLLYAEAIEGGAPFTHDYAMHRMIRALQSMTPLKERTQTLAQISRLQPELAYRNALANQAFVYASTRETVRSGTPLERSMAHTERMRSLDRTMIAARTLQTQQQTQAGIAFVQSVMSAANAVANAMIAAVRSNRMAVMSAQLDQAYRTHAESLQGGVYIRPRYENGRGWSLALVDLTTGRRADILLSLDNTPLSSAANLPVFAVDAASSRILSKGLGLEADFETYRNLAPGGGSRVSNWNIPYPSILAFDLASLRFQQPSGRQALPPRPAAPGGDGLSERLIAAAFQDDLAGVKKLLDAGADVNGVDEYGQTPLMAAAESLRVYDKDDLIELLLTRGADVTLKDPEGWTALEHFAIASFDAMTSGVSDGVGLLVEAHAKATQPKQ